MSETTMFQPQRADGRSDRQVVYDLMREAGPDATFDVPTIIAALQVGVSERVTRQRAGAAARAAKKLLQRERRRTIVPVRGVGYRVIRADEHLGVAVGTRIAAERKIKQGVAILRDCRLDELSDAQRTIHTGQLLVMSGVYEAVRHTSSRLDKHDKIIGSLTERVAKLESPAGT